MTTERRTRIGQLLLLVALLFGIVTMHTVGHPAEHHGGTASHGAGHGASAGHGDHAAHDAAPPAAAPALAFALVLGEDDPADGGMDPASVCLAVLGALGTALLVALGALGAAPWRAGGGSAGRVSTAPRRGPPRIGTALVRTSVLRI